ncbi:MAG: hypothetical protein AAFQ89_08180 [Cyanobacteria bacterium J06626_18]
MKSRWLSWGLFVVAYATFGQLLQDSYAGQAIWITTLIFVLVKASILTFVWTPIRKFALLGFQSDAGYSIMVLLFASLAVVAVVQFRAFAYVVVLVATAILVRIDTLIDDLGDRWAFLTLTLLPLIGLGLSWLPRLIFAE